MYEWRDYDDENDSKTCPKFIRVSFLLLEVISSIILAIFGIFTYYVVYYSFDYPNTIFEQ